MERIKSCLERLTNNNNNNNNNNNDNDNDNDNDNNLTEFVNKQNNEKNYKECVICLENMIYDEDLIIINCSHIYHKECIQKWLNRNSICPLCDYIV